MPPSQVLRNNESGLSDFTHSSSSSSSSAERYHLDEGDSRPVLLYKYRGRVRTSSQKDICAWLDKDDSLRVTKIPIPRYTSYVDVKRHDLYLPHEKALYADLPNYDSNLASIKVPSQAYWSRLILGNYADLYIVSQENSPASSQADEDSRRTSPSTTWGRETSDEARLAATSESVEQ